MNLVEKFNLLFWRGLMYVVRYETTLPPWRVSQDEVEADDPEDAVKEFYKRHDSFEEKVHSVYEKTSMITYQKVM